MPALRICLSPGPFSTPTWSPTHRDSLKPVHQHWFTTPLPRLADIPLALSVRLVRLIEPITVAQPTAGRPLDLDTRLDVAHALRLLPAVVTWPVLYHHITTTV
ncbi:uncharacterized protein LOC62_01G000229 [Vanrija pseudolonga]|uniref:Uncharacterized protein n=1 Tax=Vanrija pseudolonga TaxID=143232 RepID=A0AAF1BEY9_9TREE|nr:hypothetical protein LOC62_01G000229 [Vanrija pseudolonga]